VGGSGNGTELPAVQRKRRGTYHHGDLRRALVDAALLLIERSGAGGVTLRGAARLAGVSQTAPYRHFSDKRALLAAVAEQGFRTMSAQLREATAPFEGDPMARLRALGVAYVQFAQAHPSHFRVMFGPQTGDRSDFPALLEAAQDGFTQFLNAIAACRESGLLRTAPPDQLALTAWSTVHGLSSLVVDAQVSALGLQDVAAEALASVVVDHLLAGLTD